MYGCVHVCGECVPKWPWFTWLVHRLHRTISCMFSSSHWKSNLPQSFLRHVLYEELRFIHKGSVLQKCQEAGRVLHKWQCLWFLLFISSTYCQRFHATYMLHTPTPPLGHNMYDVCNDVSTDTLMLGFKQAWRDSDSRQEQHQSKSHKVSTDQINTYKQ